MSKGYYKDRDYPNKIIMMHDEKYLKENYIVDDELGLAFEDEESYELFLMDVRVSHFEKQYWGKYVVDVGIDVPWNDSENIIGKIGNTQVTFKPWVVNRVVTRETDPEFFI